MESGTRNQMVDRMIGAAKLDVNTYEEVEADKSATRQALLVVLIVALANGIGSTGAGGIGFFPGIIIGVVGWAMWAGITYFIGTTLLKTPETHADWGQLARGLGFAQTPGVLKVFGVVPYIGGIVFLAISIWQLAAMVVAVRQSLDYTSTGRAVGVILIGIIPYVVVLTILAALLGSF